jgi:uncharacterized protein with HEPN domain
MAARTQHYLFDIAKTGNYILKVTAGLTLEQLRSDQTLLYAVERAFEIIGEALRRLRDHDLATAQTLPEYTKIIGFRNHLIHGYDLIDYDVVWDVIENFLPNLISEVEAHLERLETGEA